ncbi:MAG: hypothetical protein A3B81_05875 [Candidatus Muproteobacteria bacterium RIFCSPHIGHO2_02_FULL_65_16]|uniref:Uncharacterized protein n=1 Tax=Candidatus Muproteobacteria bacterium RIFCSPHIGHO2_02_FULL_65_16 TaxID=1817766 RepID=A0A1F6TW36_9PROT|nr:MAG: hypothetical protein A3B81_05875 [Candidatus Muproteobacteria bacterium RIFCSPHIGHO2_02_FULL_65_16]
MSYCVIHDRRFNPWVWLFDKLTHGLLRTRRFATELLAAFRFVRKNRDCEFFFVENDYPLGLMAAIVSLFLPCAWVVGVNDTQNLKVSISYPGRQQRRRMHHIKQWVYRRADAVRANSFVTRDVLAESGCPEDKIIVVPLHATRWMLPTPDEAAAMERFRRQSRAQIYDRHALAHDSELLLIMCRLSAEKGLDLAIRALPHALERCPRLTLMICGPDRGQRAMLERLAEELGVRRQVLFTGNIAHEELKHFFAAASLHLAPSVIDTFNFSIIQAGMTQTFTLATERVGAAYWMEQMGSGRIVAGREPEAWGRAVAEHVASAERRTISASVSEALVARFRPDAVAAELLAAIERKIGFAPKSRGSLAA